MGLTVYADAALVQWPPPAVAAPAAAVVFENVPAAAALRPAMPPRAPVVAPRGPAPPPPAFNDDVVIAAPAAVQPPAARRGVGSGLLAGLPDRLMLALLRASALNPNDAQTQALMASWPLETLRSDPTAKRALWPQLRALRKQRQQR